MTESTNSLGPERALYPISVAAEVTGINPQMLRVYEQKGFVTPRRTAGGTRRYSGDELEVIAEVSGLLRRGLNFAGVHEVLRLQAENEHLRRRLDRLREENPPA